METFQLDLTLEDKGYLKDLVKLAIGNKLSDQPKPLPTPTSEILTMELGAFVTLKIGGRLRGCIGNVHGNKPLFQTIAEMAISAGFSDPRFPPLKQEEFDTLEVEISVLGPVEKVTDVNDIEVGKHGLIIRRGFHQGLLLPQVATEWGWDRETFLGQTCKKAGLPVTEWKKKKTEIFWFEAVVF